MIYLSLVTAPFFKTSDPVNKRMTSALSALRLIVQYKCIQTCWGDDKPKKQTQTLQYILPYLYLLLHFSYINPVGIICETGDANVQCLQRHVMLH